MDLLRQWRRRLLGAAAGAVIAPVAIVLAALAVGVGGGGIGGLGSLGQAFAGPEVPDFGGPPAGSAPDIADEAGRMLPRTQRRTAARSAPAGGGATGTPGGRRRTRPRRDDEPSARVRRPTTPGTGNGARPQSPSTPQPTPSPQPTPQPTPAPSTVRQVGDQVKEVTDPVPVVGPPTGEVVDLIVGTAEQLPLPVLP